MSAVEQSTEVSDPAFGLLFANYPVPMWMYDLETLAFVAVNNAAVQRYGYSRDEFLSMTIRDIRPSEDVSRLEKHIAQTRPQWQQSGEWQHRLKDGRVIDVAIISHTLEYNGRACALVTAQNISARKQAEAEARRYTRLYATLSQVNQAIVRIKDRETLFAKICEVAVEFGEFLLAWISHVEGEMGRVLPLAFAGKQVVYLKNFTDTVRTLDTMRGPMIIALGEGRLAFSQDIVNDPEMAASREAALAHGFRSTATIPLRQQGEIVGALNLYAAEPGFFTEHEQALLDEIGGDISFALDAMQAEAELLAAREFFSRLFHLSPIPTALLRQRDRVYTDVNQAFEELMGRRRSQMVGRSSDEIIFWVDQEKRQELIKTLIATGSVRDLEYDFVTAAGRTRTGLLYADVVTHQGEEYFLSAVLDITERKQAEVALKQQAQTMRLHAAALEAAANAIVITDRNGIIEWANPAFTTLTGYTLEEAIGKNPRDLLRSGRHDREFYQTLWETILAGNVWQGEIINQRKDGTLYTEEQTITPVRDERGEISHFVAIKHDVTREREVQTQIQRQERLAAVGQLAAGIAHDFNNIMAVIVLYSQMTARSPLLSDRERERLATIHNQAQHGAHMIQQILDFSRRAVVERRPLDLLPLLKEHIKLLQRTLPEHIEIAFHSEHDEYIVRADPTRIQQTIMNLAVNARDAMPAGGKLEIRLDRIRVEEGNASIPNMEAGTWVRLSIADTGTGIPEHLIERIFEPFFTTKAPGDGTGLGLAQVHGIIGEHDGHISVDSSLGEGTTFTIFLPALSSMESKRPALDFGALPRGKGETVLVVEDNAEVQAALVETLEQLNYRTIRAADGESALTILFTDASGNAAYRTRDGQESRVHLVLSDVVMPRMGGIELVRALRDRGYTMPVILITGHPLDSNIDGLHTLGVSTWLTKPLSPQQIATAISDALNEKSTE